MNQNVSIAIEELKLAYPDSEITVTDDSQGGAYVIVEQVELGTRFSPPTTWMGGHINTFYPHADIYPVFIDAGVSRVDGKPFEVPITPGASFQGRSAVQVSRINNQIHLAPQTAVSKFAKIRHFLDTLP